MKLFLINCCFKPPYRAPRKYIEHGVLCTVCSTDHLVACSLLTGGRQTRQSKPLPCSCETVWLQHYTENVRFRARLLFMFAPSLIKSAIPSVQVRDCKITLGQSEWLTLFSPISTIIFSQSRSINLLLTFLFAQSNSITMFLTGPFADSF